MTSPSTSPGLQNERTALAWQRTALAVLAGAAVVTRMTLHRLGIFALVGLLVAIPICVWVLVESRSRYRHDAAPQARTRSRGGRSHGALALAIALLAMMELAALVVAP
ncbi:DUF202 domain-containing protein [Aldersonia sp. NBC_00410]|uniref:DUF202 domain-containing protein n=1 Tax=Aldersonia sp. NBC_00410 TaxID=2975954 RepID=UPI002251DC3C|nr:DUF202 domain-containing protein [Aldersonia sp. NBC_00410]MCX5046211.1 DUF202 domain-containing protein [Aldersonia sp. NBC_00410]